MTPAFRTRLLVVIAVVGAALAMLAWAISAPIGSSPDDGKHLPSIWCAYGAKAGICEFTPGPENTGQATVPLGLGWGHGCWSWIPEQSAACYPFRDVPLPDQDRISADTSFVYQTPGLYYKAMYWLTSDNLEQSVLRIRLANILLALLLVGGAALVSTGTTRLGLILAWLVTPIPLGISIIPTTNPSAWAVIGIGTYWAFLLAHWQATTPRRRIAAGIGAVVAAILAIGGRTDSTAFVVLVTAAVALLYWTPRWRELQTRWPVLIVPAAASLAAILVFLRTPQSGVATGGMAQAGTDTGLSASGLFARNVTQLPGLWLGNFGKWPLGTLDITLPDGVMFAAGVSFFALLFLGLRQMDAGKTFGVLIVFAGVSLLPLWIYQRGNITVGQEIQPRYFLPLFFVLLGFAVLTPAGRRLLDLSIAQKIVILALLTGAVTISLFEQMHRYTVGDGTYAETFTAPEWWSQTVISPSVTFALGVIGFAAWAICALMLLPRGDDVPPDDASSSSARREHAATR